MKCKKGLLCVSMLLVILLISISSLSIAGSEEDVIAPPEDAKEMIGKIITFSEGQSSRSSWSSLITGISKQSASMGEAVVVYISGVSYMGDEVKKIVYVRETSGTWWQIEYYVSNKKNSRIKVLTIE